MLLGMGFWFKYHRLPMGITNVSAIYGETIGRFTRIVRELTGYAFWANILNYCEQQYMVARVASGQAICAYR